MTILVEDQGNFGIQVRDSFRYKFFLFRPDIIISTLTEFKDFYRASHFIAQSVIALCEAVVRNRRPFKVWVYSEGV